jgi:hypothetical protein
MVSASLVMTGPFGADGMAAAPIAPPDPPPQALNAIAAAMMQIARRISPSKSPAQSIFATQQTEHRDRMT